MADFVEMGYGQAVNAGLKEEMRRDERVVTWSQGARRGGAVSLFGGLYDEFGGDRVIDTPITEIAMIDMGLGRH